MSTSRFGSKHVAMRGAVVLETRHVWAPTLQGAMDKAQQLEWQDWKIVSNPAPMEWRGEYGTGVTIMRTVYDE